MKKNKEFMTESNRVVFTSSGRVCWKASVDASNVLFFSGSYMGNIQNIISNINVLCAFLVVSYTS